MDSVKQQARDFQHEQHKRIMIAMEKVLVDIDDFGSRASHEVKLATINNHMAIMSEFGKMITHMDEFITRIVDAMPAQ